MSISSSNNGDQNSCQLHEGLELLTNSNNKHLEPSSSDHGTGFYEEVFHKAEPSDLEIQKFRDEVKQLREDNIALKTVLAELILGFEAEGRREVFEKKE